jgi:hypothetical protein
MQQTEWQGSQPQRFSGGRRHLAPEDELNSYLNSNTHIHPVGIKVF